VLENQGASEKTLAQVIKLLPNIPIDTIPMETNTIDTDTTPKPVGDKS
jgi:3-deoxy-D-manno-octulosonic-acid transferase